MTPYQGTPPTPAEFETSRLIGLGVPAEVVGEWLIEPINDEQEGD